MTVNLLPPGFTSSSQHACINDTDIINITIGGGGAYKVHALSAVHLYLEIVVHVGLLANVVLKSLCSQSAGTS